MAIVRLLLKQIGERRLADREPGRMKVIYMAPIKVLFLI